MVLEWLKSEWEYSRKPKHFGVKLFITIPYGTLFKYDIKQVFEVFFI